MKTFLVVTLLMIGNYGFSQSPNCDAIKTENTKITKSLSILKDDKKKLQDTIADLRINNAALQDTISSLKIQYQNLQDQLNVAIKQNDYFRETLKIFETKLKVVSNSKIDFNLLSCEGNIQDQTVTIQLLLINHDVNKNIMFTPDNDAIKAIDLQGNAYNYKTIKFSDQSWGTQLNTEVPTKLKITLSGVLQSIMLLKMIDLKCTINNVFPQSEIIFKDITIVWK